ncbi:MAG: 6,7-dimethyl-8-ribityllumazine synthase [Actinomycetota bacterium]|jgi:6,7-dimethyl-8-ribityllumazine synthase|nr:6,7-dimethyl-8-ribityllumazine synthase [Actinomycetota bacterium]
MTSSDQTALPNDAKARAAERVRSVVDGADARVARVAFVCAEFNGGITSRLLVGALDVLDERGVATTDRALVWVPGAFEAPLAAARLAGSGAWDAIICLGAVIRGDTGHYDFVAGQCAAGLERVQLDTGVPVVFGVLTTDTVDQALDRSMPDATNKGREAALTALAMVSVLSGAGALR